MQKLIVSLLARAILVASIMLGLFTGTAFAQSEAGPSAQPPMGAVQAFGALPADPCADINATIAVFKKMFDSLPPLPTGMRQPGSSESGGPSAPSGAGSLSIPAPSSMLPALGSVPSASSLPTPAAPTLDNMIAQLKSICANIQNLKQGSESGSSGSGSQGTGSIPSLPLDAGTQARLNNAFQPQSGSGSSAPTNSCAPFTTNLHVGSQGSEVTRVQKFLNRDLDTQLASSGAGSPGNESAYFGPLMRAAVIKFQEKYAADILTPNGLTAGSGYWGPSTRAKATALNQQSCTQ